MSREELFEESWKELDGKVLTITVEDSGPNTYQVWGEDEEGNSFLLHEGQACSSSPI